MTSSDFVARASVATGSAFLVVTFSNFAMRVISQVDVETALTIVIVSLVASVFSGLISAWLFKKQLPLILFSQILAATLVAVVASL